VKTQQPALPAGVRREQPRDLAEDQAVEREVQQSLEKPEFPQKNPAAGVLLHLRAALGLERERAVKEAQAHLGSREETRVALDDLEVRRGRVEA
jgi:hypothetical protein